MCNWKSWILPGLLTVALLSAFALWLKADSIESDLLTKSSKALENIGFKWVTVHMDGRDAVVTGLAPSEESQSLSAVLVNSAYDVRVVDNRTNLMAVQSPYIFSAEKAGNTVVVSGYAPTSSVRTEIIAAATKALPDSEIIDRLELARGVPQNFQEIIEFGFARLTGLADGKVNWSDQNLAISGVARNSLAYNAINAALSGGLPNGSRLVQSDVLTPVAAPYDWAASYDGTVLAFTGHVPSDELRKDIIQAAKLSLPDAAIADELSLASGAPQNFKTAAEFSLQQLAHFSSGSVAISDLELSIRGVSLNAAAYAVAKRAVTGALPDGLSLAQEAISPAVISPFSWAANYNGTEIALTGFVPDALAREEIINNAKSILPGVVLKEQMQIADGAPPEFLQAVSFALNQLPRFVSGEVALSDLELSVKGKAIDPGAYDEANAEIGSALPASMTLASSKIGPPSLSPYLWSAEYDGKILILGGFVPDGDSRQAILESASGILPKAAINDRMRFGAGVPQGFAGATDFALRQLKHLTAGSVALSDLALTIDGAAADSDAFTHATDAIAGDLPGAMTIASQSIKPPVVSPYQWAADYDGTRLLLNGFVPNDDTRASIMRVTATTLPTAEIEDQMQTAAGEPERFSEVVELALSQLKRFESGFVQLSDLELTVRGTATDPDAYVAAKAALGGDMPLAIKLSDQDIKAAIVSPYTWSAGYDGDAVVLQGFVPDETAREDVLAAVAKALPATTVTDQMQIAAGAPKNHVEATSGAIAVLPWLSQGSVALADFDLVVEGIAKSTATYPEVESYLAGDLPGAMNLKSTDIQPPAVSGEYLWQASMSGETIVLEGSAPSKEGRAQIEETARDTHPEKDIDNRLVIETGASDNFVSTASSMLRMMSNFSKGTVRIKGTSVDITGDAKSVSMYETVLEAIGEDVGDGFTWGRRNIGPASVSPYSWWVERRGDSQALGGFVPARNIGVALADEAQRKFDSSVENQQRLAAGAPENFEKATSALIASVSMLQDSKGAMTDNTIEIEGRASSETEAGKIASDLQVDLPSNYRLRTRITHLLPKIASKPQSEPGQPQKKPKLKATETEAVPDVAGGKSEARLAPEVAKSDPAPEPKPVAAPSSCNVDFKSLFRGEKILFETARAVILDESAALLLRIAAAAQKCDGALIEVGGHTDSRGSRRYNQALSEARATAVVAYLTEQGVPIDRLVAKGYGESKPIASNRRPKTRFKNRRIEFRALEAN